jgi:hypothetical protein
MQIDDTLILINDAFAIAEEETIKTIDIKIKSRNQLALKQLIKFNKTVIELESDENITLRQKIRQSDSEEISLIQNRDASSTSIRNIIRINLSSKN